MPRPRIRRRVRFEPDVTYFKPAGVPMINLREAVLTVDEFESVRLKDLLGLDQEEAAKKMNISQPTFHRLVSSARKKIADALVNGKAIKIKGGNYTIQRQGRGFGRPAMTCVCPECGYEEKKIRRAPCSGRECPECRAQMIRGD